MSKNEKGNPWPRDMFCGVGEKIEKSRKGIFKPTERICILDEYGLQLSSKNANLETFILTTALNVTSLQK